MEEWSSRILEWWNIGIMGLETFYFEVPTIPLFQHSTIPFGVGYVFCHL
jgi:hypothetical protein